MKKSRILARCVFGLVLILTVILSRQFFRTGKPYTPPVFAVYQDSSDLKQTVVVPTLDAKMPKDKNVIWCASFQLAWNRLGTDVLHEPPAVANAEEIVAQLNGSKFSENDLSKDCFYAVAGRCSEGIVNAIEKNMRQQFQKQLKIDLTDPTNAIVAYGYLEASIPFSVPFFDNDDMFVFHDGKGEQTSVASFGICGKHEYAYDRLRRQISVLYVPTGTQKRNREGNIVFEEFVIDPCKDSSPNQIVLACVKPKDTLAATVDYIEKLTTGKKENSLVSEFGPRDVLLVPNMAWDITRHFVELEGKDKRLLNKENENNYMAAALQTIRFRLDRSGAELASEAASFCKPAAKDYIYDRPFVIYIKKRDSATPFFAMYVDNAELLCKAAMPSEAKTPHADGKPQP
jgi:hypothetical protein